MILTPHHTRCPACGQFVYVMDDLLAVEPGVGIDAINGAVTGLYHYSCFKSVPWREAFLRWDAQVKNQVFDQESQYWLVLGRTEAFALALRPAIETYVLYFLTKGRRFEFHGPAAWQEFRAAIIGSQAARPIPATGPRIRVRHLTSGWELSSGLLVPVQADFTSGDFARLQQHLTDRGIDPGRRPVNLGVVCSQLGITPTRISCPLERLIGTFSWPQAAPNPTQPVTLTVRVEQSSTVVLDDVEMKHLRDFLQSLQRPIS